MVVMLNFVSLFEGEVVKKCNFYVGVASIIITSPVLLHPLQHIAVIGTGYVGLVTAAGLAHCGNQVTAVDTNEQKIDALRNGIMPIYEPGLDRLVKDTYEAKRLTFSTDVQSAIAENDILMIAVGTPMADNGAADLSYIAHVMDTIATSMNDFKIICIKSTVPVGTGSWARTFLHEKGIASDRFCMVSNPEFLREGSAVADFLHPDRIVLGIECERSFSSMHDMYAPLIDQGVPVVKTTLETSEMIKYASNAFLAVKLSFINEIANLCDALHADVKDVSYAMGLDKRICPYFLRPGPGFGGSCFPKDSSALLYTATLHGVDLKVVAASLATNEAQKEVAFKKLLAVVDGDIVGKTIAVWGLAFKANTDDIRYSPALRVIECLVHAGANVRVYDPAAMENTRALFPDLYYAHDMYNALDEADALVVMTEWSSFGNADLTIVIQRMRHPVIIDARAVFDPQQLVNHGIIFDMIGRSCSAVKN